MAKPMVKLAQSISTKIREKQGEITEDETVQFKSYLLSLGIDDPITKVSTKTKEYEYEVQNIKSIKRAIKTKKAKIFLTFS